MTQHRGCGTLCPAHPAAQMWYQVDMLRGINSCPKMHASCLGKATRQSMPAAGEVSVIPKGGNRCDGCGATGDPAGLGLSAGGVISAGRVLGAACRVCWGSPCVQGACRQQESGSVRAVGSEASGGGSRPVWRAPSRAGRPEGPASGADLRLRAQMACRDCWYDVLRGQVSLLVAWGWPVCPNRARLRELWVQTYRAGLVSTDGLTTGGTLPLHQSAALTSCESCGGAWT